MLISMCLFLVFNLATAQDVFNSLRVSEVMLSAAAPNDLELYNRYTPSNFDYIELTNIGTQDLNLKGLGIDGPITFLLSKGTSPGRSGIESGARDEG
jgi:hypothetical protein